MIDALTFVLRTQLLLAIMAVCSSALGGTIYWNMNTLAAPTSNTVADLNVGAITQGNSTTTGGSTVSASSGYSFLLDGTSTTASGSTNLNFSTKPGVLLTASSSYMAVTLTPSPGSTGTVSAIGFGSRSTPSGPTTLSLRSSLDDYATEVSGFVPTADSNWAYFTDTFSTPLIVASGSSLTLRLYGAGGSTATTGNWRIDDLQFNVVVVPEPAALALGLLGVAGIVRSVWRTRLDHRESKTRCAEPVPASPSSNCSS